jgi:protein-S-isoprenylcysteine O-methyltransferase Ste14
MASLYILLKTAIFSVFVPGTVAGFIPQQLARRDQESLPVGSGVARLMGGVAVISGVVLYFHTAWRFSDEGRGTPSPIDEPETLVTGGIYGYIRNPMYIAVLLCIGGQAFLYRSTYVLLYGIVSWLVSHTWIIEYEEPHLTEKYGEKYDQYCDRVPRWIPQFHPADEG